MATRWTGQRDEFAKDKAVFCFWWLLCPGLFGAHTDFYSMSRGVSDGYFVRNPMLLVFVTYCVLGVMKGLQPAEWPGRNRCLRVKATLPLGKPQSEVAVQLWLGQGAKKWKRSGKLSNYLVLSCLGNWFFDLFLPLVLMWILLH